MFSLIFYGLKKRVEKMLFCNQTDQTTKFDESKNFLIKSQSKDLLYFIIKFFFYRYPDLLLILI